MLTASKPMVVAEWSLDSEALEGLVVAGQRGSREAQRRIYELCQQRVFRLLVRMVGINDAEDVLQQVFLKVFRTLGQFKGQSRFETWLYRVAVNESLQHLRKLRRRSWVSLDCDFMDSAPGHECELDYKELLERGLSRLAADLRVLFVLREIEGQSYEEIAEALRIPEGTVASRLCRARQLLKQQLIEMGWES